MPLLFPYVCECVRVYVSFRCNVFVFFLLMGFFCTLSASNCVQHCIKCNILPKLANYGVARKSRLLVG